MSIGKALNKLDFLSDLPIIDVPVIVKERHELSDRFLPRFIDYFIGVGTISGEDRDSKYGTCVILKNRGTVGSTL